MGMDKIIEDKRLIKPKHWKYIIGTIGLILVIVSFSFKDNSRVYKIEKDKLAISTVFKGDFNDYIRIVGQVEPIKTIYMDVEEGGKVEEIMIEEGEMVSKGDVILQLKNNDLNMTIMNSESNLAYQTNELRNTMIQIEQQKNRNQQELLRMKYENKRLERDYKYKKGLYEKNLIAREVYLYALEDYEFAQGNQKLIHEKLVRDSIFRENQKSQMDMNLNNMERSLKMVRQRLENLKVKAPIDGQLGLLNAEIGESIHKGKRIGQVNVLSSFKIKAKIDEHYIDRVKKNLEGDFDRQNKKYKVRIRKVYPEVRDGQFEVELLFTGTLPENIRTGQTYYLNLQLGGRVQAIQVERGGFFQSTGGQWVFVLSPDGKFAIKRNIKIARQNPRYYEITEGLDKGEQVITSNYDIFGDNDKIVLK